MKHKLERRTVIKRLAGLTGVAAAPILAGASSTQPANPGDTELNTVRTPGRPPSLIGARAPEVKIQRQVLLDIASATPLQDLHGALTPADLHFERHHAGIPAIDSEQHELLIHGMVDKAIKFSVADLKRFPSVTRICFLECSGNLLTTVTERSTPQLVCGLTSQSEWTGVSLRTLFTELGVKPGASWFLAEGGDAALMTRSIPLEKAMDDAFIAYAQNGEPLRPEQGFPIRLLLPGWEGNTSIKWLRRLELSDQPFMTREETSKYTDPLKNGTARQFSVIMDARSVITAPTFPVWLEKGWHEIRGLAWSGRGKIVRVDVSTDGGRHWHEAVLQGPVLSKAHTRFSLPWQWRGGAAELMSRAVDETGYVQPSRRQILDTRGPGSVPYHLNPILSWLVQSDGQVLYKAEPWI
ncbi:MAG: sulfite dehydrogenase [Pseudomonadales bacterium]